MINENDFIPRFKTLVDDYKSRAEVFRGCESHYIKDILFTIELIQDAVVHISGETAQSAYVNSLSGVHITRAILLSAYPEVIAYLETLLDYVKNPSMSTAMRLHKTTRGAGDALISREKEINHGKTE